MENYIQVKNLTKRYKTITALKDIDLDIPKGKIVGLMGKNGAGKSTLLKCMLGLLRYEGTISMFGKSISEWKHDLYGRVAFIPDVSGLDPRLTVEQTIDFTAAVNESWNWDKSKRLFAESDLPCDQKVGTLSKGMKTKLYLLLTLSKDVDVLLLDEPTLGLDIVFRKEFYDLLLGEFYDEEKTVIISTHQVAEVENILQDVIFIDRGEILLNRSVDQLKEDWKIIEVSNAQEETLMQYNPSVYTKTLGHVRGLVEGKVEIEGAKFMVPNLSEIFVALTQSK
ncbi:MAG: ABC transporter ATP-binding protein [Candidatus Marinimicrobia bacterium]|nr:ABC transporter ATP-binding protein [Candidatus Neomarinimicrobiota bacterium]